MLVRVARYFLRSSVDDFPEISVEMDYKPLNLFYDAVCSDFTSRYGAKCDNYYTDILFGEYGRVEGRRTKEFSLDVRIYLVRQRLYQAKVAMRNSLEKDEQTIQNVTKFMDSFLFVHRKMNEKKYSFGLPKSLSQNLERLKNDPF